MSCALKSKIKLIEIHCRYNSYVQFAVAKLSSAAATALKNQI